MKTLAVLGCVATLGWLVWSGSGGETARAAASAHALAQAEEQVGALRHELEECKAGRKEEEEKMRKQLVECGAEAGRLKESVERAVANASASSRKEVHFSMVSFNILVV